MAAIASWMEDQRWILILFWIFFNFRTTDAAIFLDGDTNRTVYVGESPHIKWTFDNAEKMTSIDWYFKNTSATITIMTFQPALTPPLIIHSNFNVEHVSGGEIQLTNVKLWNAGTYTCYVTYNISLSIPAETGIVNVAVEEGTTTSSTSTAISITLPTSGTTTTHLVTPNTSSSTSTSTTTTVTASISTTTTPMITASRTTSSTLPSQTVTQSEQDGSKTVVIVVPSVVGGLFVIGIAVTVALVWKFRKNKNLHNKSIHHKEGHSKKENKGRHLKRQPEYSEYIPSHHHGFSAKQLYGYKMYSGKNEIKRNPLYSHHLDRHMNMSYVTNSSQYHYNQLYNGNQFLGYQMPSARADSLYTRRGHMMHPEHRYQYPTNPRATILRTQDNTIVTDYTWNWN